MSAGAENQGDDQFVEISRDVYEHPEALKKNLKLLHFVVGDQDVLHEADKRLAALLTAHGVKLTFQTVPGMHEYKVWRQGLRDVAPLHYSLRRMASPCALWVALLKIGVNLGTVRF